MAEKYFLHIRSWDEGTEELSLDQEAFYLRLINLMYRYDGALPDNDDLLHFKTRTSMRMFKKLKKQLLDMEKIFIKDGLLMNTKVNLELDFINEKSAKNSRAAKIKHAKVQRKLSQKKPKLLEYKEKPSANAQQTLCIDGCESPAIQGNRGTGDNKNIQKEIIEKDFDEFWTLCLRKKSKAQALINYKKARKDTDKDLIHNSMKAYSKNCEEEGTEEKYIKKPSNWLTAGMYNDQLEMNGYDYLNASNSTWKARIKAYKRNGNWHDEWGFKPDENGNDVPESILRENNYQTLTNNGSE